MARAKVKRIEVAKKKINELLQEVEYDVIWHFLQHYFDTLSERQLLELIEFVEKTLSIPKADEDHTFPPKALNEN